MGGTRPEVTVAILYLYRESRNTIPTSKRRPSLIRFGSSARHGSSSATIVVRSCRARQQIGPAFQLNAKKRTRWMVFQVRTQVFCCKVVPIWEFCGDFTKLL